LNISGLNLGTDGLLSLCSFGSFASLDVIVPLGSFVLGSLDVAGSFVLGFFVLGSFKSSEPLFFLFISSLFWFPPNALALLPLGADVLIAGEVIFAKVGGDGMEVGSIVVVAAAVFGSVFSIGVGGLVGEDVLPLEGDSVGDELGDIVRGIVGKGVGEIVGKGVGEIVGKGVGEIVGKGVGDIEGEGVEGNVGKGVGETEGRLVGDTVNWESF